MLMCVCVCVFTLIHTSLSGFVELNASQMNAEETSTLGHRQALTLNFSQSAFMFTECEQEANTSFFVAGNCFSLSPHCVGFSGGHSNYNYDKKKQVEL